ncbi:MAG TPA: hypothetical protein VMV99_01105 [Rhodanobacter sp.]|nr:hypothetical protein [Rhodanobacter sp.]
MNRGKIFGILVACVVLATFADAASAQQGSTSQDIKHDAKAAGKDIGHGARDIGHETRHVATNIGHGAKEAGHGIAKGARTGWDATRHAVKDVFHKGH